MMVAKRAVKEISSNIQAIQFHFYWHSDTLRVHINYKQHEIYIPHNTTDELFLSCIIHTAVQTALCTVWKNSLKWTSTSMDVSQWLEFSTADPLLNTKNVLASTSKDLVWVECSLPHQMHYSLLFSSSSSSKDVTVVMLFVALASPEADRFQPFLETMGLGLINDRLSSRSNFSLASLVNLIELWEGAHR